MRVLPILFNTEMVRAILEGRKSCTRRSVISRQFLGMLPDKCKNAAPDEFLKGKRMMFKPYCDMTDAELIMTAYKAPYEPDDILYVRETWHKYIKRVGDGKNCHLAEFYGYKASVANSEDANEPWEPSIYMPKEAARIWLNVTNVMVERLQEITAESALAEGADKYIHLNGKFDENAILTSFIGIWNSTIKKSDLDRFGWNANPWVWVIEFERCKKPEDNQN